MSRRPDYEALEGDAAGRWHRLRDCIAGAEAMLCVGGGADCGVEVLMARVRRKLRNGLAMIETLREEESAAALQQRGQLDEEQSREAAEVSALRESIRRGEDRYRLLVDNLEDVVFSLDERGTITFISAAIKSYGYEPVDVIGRDFVRFVHPEDLERLRESFGATLAGHRAPLEFRVLDATGKVRHVRTLSRAVSEGDRVVGTTGVLVDVTQQRMTELQLRMSQKMEAVGRLAGGIAHDFNNITSVVLTYSGFVLDALPKSDPMRDDVREIMKAAERAAVLTSHLLAFGRKQILQPRVVELNELVEGVGKMLRRVIGEDIELVIRLAADVGWSKVDPGQIEQVLLTVAANSRDAMPEGGHLTIETSRVQLRLDDLQSGEEVTPGSYALLSVADDGCGMDEATAARAFDPFFTTKEVGRGTGLGLATVYGIIRQSGGMVRLSSRPEEGTTLRIYLPTLETGEQEPLPASSRRALPRGSESILVVEDEEAVRNLVSRVLGDRGYELLTASDADEALRVFAARGGQVDLVITDVVMPGMSGRKLADRLAALHPGWARRVLYMSGYPLRERDLPAEGTHFISKPFTAGGLAEAVRRILDTES